MDAYYEWLRRSYGDLHEPDYRFVAEAVARHPYHHLLGELRSVATVQDTSEWDDSVAYCLRLDVQGQVWWLWLSLVGPYALLYRGGPGPVVDRSAVVDGAEQARRVGVEPVYHRVVDAGFRLLGSSELDRRVEFDPVNEHGPVSLFEALFSAVTAPWVSPYEH